jgi:niacin transporter
MINQKNKVITMTIAALLCAIAIMIPTYFPRIMIEPASFTLASHVPVFIAMFISPMVAISVAIISAIGFFISFPLVIALRAFTHVIFAVLGALILKKNKNILQSWKSTVLFSLLISVVHAVGEVIIVTYFYWGDQMSEAFYTKGYILSVLILVGLGTIIHSMVDFTIASFVWRPLQHVITIPTNAKFGKLTSKKNSNV